MSAIDIILAGSSDDKDPFVSAMKEPCLTLPALKEIAQPRL
jgi:hypothetical protein